MKKPWFRRWGWVHCPASLPGALIVLLAAAFCAQVFWAVDRRSHSVSDTFYGIFPFVSCAFLLVEWVASRTGDGGR